MLLAEPQLPNISENVNWLSKVVWPALATLVPAAVTAVFRWMQDHSSRQRSAALTERIADLSKKIGEIPELPLNNGASALTPKSVLTVELQSAMHELTAIQRKSSLLRLRGITSAAARMRAALLFYRPQGVVAWFLHLTFYAYSILLIFFLVLLTTGESSTPLIASVSDAFAFIAIFGVLGIPPLVLRYFAARIHTAQCAKAQLDENPLAAPLAT